MESEGVVPINNPTFNPKMVNHTITVYYFPGSPPSRAAMMVIKALGIKHNTKIVNLLAGEHLKPDFIKVNPMHTLPTIDDNGFILWESHAIMKYLVDQYAKDDSLFPRDPKKGAVVNQRLFFNVGTLFPRLMAYAHPVMFGEGQPDQAKASKFEEALGYLDTFLNDSPWVAGQELTVADFAIISVIASAEAAMFNFSKYANIPGWYQRAKDAMAGFGYQEINQVGADLFGGLFKSKLK